MRFSSSAFWYFGLDNLAHVGCDDAVEGVDSDPGTVRIR